VYEGCYLLNFNLKLRGTAKPHEYITVSPMSLVCPRCNAEAGKVCEVLIDEERDGVYIERIQWVAAMDALAKKA
jgi:hypothetical protein